MSSATTTTVARVGIPAGGSGRASLTISSVHVCQVAKNLTFDTARSFVAPTADNKAALADLLTKLRIGGTQNRLLITGHTDQVGGRTANQQLSVRRTQAVQAILQGDPTGTAVWETVFNAEGWGNPELTAMATEVGEMDISRFRGAANRTARLDLFRRYFDRLLGGTTVPPITATTPPLLACGPDQPLHGSRTSPSRDTSLPPITGEFRPNRRSEFFFFDSAATPITCSEYPNWTVACSLTPPAPTVTVTIAPIDTVRTGSTISVQITINPSPLPFGTQVNLTLRSTSGTGEARFAANNGTTLPITASGPVIIRGVTVSSAVDNISLSATVLGQTAVLAQEIFTVVAAFSFFVQFEVFNLTTKVFEPLPAGIDVDLMDQDPGIDDRVATRPTEAGGRVSFNLPDLSASGETNPDLFFLVHTNGRTHAGNTLPATWSTAGWKATDGTPGLQRRFSGTTMGTPSVPIIFRVGLDFHARFTYLNPFPSPHDEPAVKGLPVRVQSGPIGAPPKATVQTDDQGEVHGLLFNVNAGDDFSFTVDFEMTDASINLPRARVNSPAGWNTVLGDADGKVIANNDRTSVGTPAGPEIFRATIADRPHSFFMLKMLRAWSTFWFHITGGAWTGVQDLLLFNTVIPPATASFSFPVGQVHIHPGQQFRPEILAHELTHQVMWKEADFGSLAIFYEGTAGNLILTHQVNLIANPQHALIEGWPQLAQAVFSTRRTPPYPVSTVRDSSNNLSPLGPPPAGQGERVEGAFANALWAIFENHVVRLPRDAHVPDTPNGNILGTTAGAYLRDTTVRDRFLSSFFRPLQDLKPLFRPETTDMIAKMKNRNLPDWHKMLPEFQAFNLAMTLPTVKAISPTGGPPAGGTRVTITGTDFTLTNTSVTIRGTPATAVTVLSHTSLTAVTPVGVVGPADVVVTTLPGASDPLAGGFVYAQAPVVSSVTVIGQPPGTPARGPMGQETRITIRGTGFQPDAVVLIGGEPATAVVTISPTEITARSPRRRLPLLPGGVPVVVRNPDLQEGVLNPGFEYFLSPAPVIVDVIPNTGSFLASTPIRITGANFQPADVLVFFDRIPAVPVPVGINRGASSATEISAVTPAVAAPVTMDVRVESPDGQFNLKPGGFTYTP